MTGTGMEKVFRLVAGEGCWIGVVGGWLGKLKFNSSVPAGKVGEGGGRGGGGNIKIAQLKNAQR